MSAHSVHLECSCAASEVSVRFISRLEETSINWKVNASGNKKGALEVAKDGAKGEEPTEEHVGTA